MPLIRHFHPNQNITVGIWKITESLEKLISYTQLNEKEIQKLKDFKSEERKLQWVCTRKLLQTILNQPAEIQYLESKKPFLKGQDYNISITHSKNFVALSLNNKSETGIDLEMPKSRIHNIKKRFLNEFEKSNFNCEDIEELTKIWAAKEALYKIFGDRNVFFKEHIQIHPPKNDTNKSIFTGDIIHKGNKHSYYLGFEKVDKHILVYIYDQI